MQNEPLHELLFNQIPFPCLLLTLSPVSVRGVNRQAREQFGVAEGQSFPMEITDLLTPDQMEQLIEGLRREPSESEPIGRWSLQNGQGQLRPAEASLCLFDSGGERGALLTLRPSLLEPPLQDALSDGEAFIRTALESLPGLFYMLNEQQQYILWNRNMEEVLECTPDELRAAHPFQFYRKEDHEEIAQKIGEAFTAGNAEVEADLISMSGRVSRHILTGRFFESGGKRYIIGCGVDISDRKRYEEALLETIEEKQVLLQEIHHRVKNNLAVISGLLEMQSLSSPDPSIRKILSDSQLRIKSMALIHEKLYQSQNLSKINLATVLDDLLLLSRQVLDPEQRITIRSVCAATPMSINQALPATL